MKASRKYALCRWVLCLALCLPCTVLSTRLAHACEAETIRLCIEAYRSAQGQETGTPAVMQAKTRASADAKTNTGTGTDARFDADAEAEVTLDGGAEAGTEAEAKENAGSVGAAQAEGGRGSVPIGEADTAGQGIPQKRVALTFDDGPHPVYTQRIVDRLEEVGGHATFFVIGDLVTEETAPSLSYLLAHGNELGLHSQTHRHNFATCAEDAFAWELEACRASIAKYTDAEIRLMRPPQGKITAERVGASPYTTVLWSIDSEDWRHQGHATAAEELANIEAILSRVLDHVQDGDIILMHEIYRNSYRAFCILLDTLHKEGFSFVTVSELFAGEPPAGEVYRCLP